MSGRTARYSRHEWPTCPKELKERHGEDPCRFLACTELDLAFARIQMLESVVLCNFWEAMERRHFGKRDEVLHAIGKRRDELQAQEAADE